MKTLRTPVSRVSTLFVVAAAFCLAQVPTASAGTVRGTVKMPDASRSTRLYHGYWRLENVKGAHAPSARTITIEMGGLDARPRLVITGPGSVIELKNTGKVRHALSTPDKPATMQLETLMPGQTRRQRFDALGEYVIRDSEYPHIMICVLVVGTTYFSAVDDKGAFSIANVPDSTATLKVWARGSWVAEQQLDTATLGKEELTIKVVAKRDREKAEQEAKAAE